MVTSPVSTSGTAVTADGAVLSGDDAEELSSALRYLPAATWPA